MDNDFQNVLTAEQAEIVKLRGHQVLTACPGAGKTRIIGARLSMLASKIHRSNGKGVAAITFTNAAVNEIKNVYRKLTGREISSPHYVGTIDSFINHFLFQPFGHLALGDPVKKSELITPGSNILDFIYKGYRYSKLHKVKRARYTYNVDGEIVPSSNDHEIRKAVADMKKDMKEKNLATVSDASYWTLVLLRDNPHLCTVLAKRFPFIMIDEAQDCSDVQMAIVDEMVIAGHSEIMLVGDVFQAIYEFREAKPELLAKKRSEEGWNSKILAHTHRCRENISKFINHTSVTDDPVRRQLISVNKDCNGTVCILDEDSSEKIANRFLTLCKDNDIIPDVNDVAILYGAHSSNLSINKISVNEIGKLFATDHREKYVALTMAFRYKHLSRYDIALREIMELLYQLKFNKSSHEAKREELDCESLEMLRPKMWKFCKSLPDINFTLENWVCETNMQLKDLLSELDLDNTFQLKLNRQIGVKKSQLIKSLILGEESYATGLPATVTNIHQVKGKTFKAVLLYLDDNRKKVSGKKLMKLLNGEKPFHQMNEDDRCIYVAITRAEKLLCFAGDIAELKDWYAANFNITNNETH